MLTLWSDSGPVYNGLYPFGNPFTFTGLISPFQPIRAERTIGVIVTGAAERNAGVYHCDILSGGLLSLIATLIQALQMCGKLGYNFFNLIDS